MHLDVTYALFHTDGCITGVCESVLQKVYLFIMHVEFSVVVSIVLFYLFFLTLAFCCRKLRQLNSHIIQYFAAITRLQEAQ